MVGAESAALGDNPSGHAPRDCTSNVRQLSTFASSRKGDPSVAYRTIKWFALEGTLIAHLVQLPAMSRDSFN